MKVQAKWTWVRPEYLVDCEELRQVGPAIVVCALNVFTSMIQNMVLDSLGAAYDLIKERGPVNINGRGI